jgi:hypothetical protein
MGMTQDLGAPGTHIVDISIAIRVEDEGAGRPFDENRITPYSFKRPDRRIHAAGDVLQGLAESFLGVGHG